MISDCIIRIVLVDGADDSNPRPVILLEENFVLDSVPGRDLIGPLDIIRDLHTTKSKRIQYCSRPGFQVAHGPFQVIG